MSPASSRQEAILSTISQVRSLLGDSAPDRAKLDKVLGIVKGLAAEVHMWGEGDFPGPDEEARQARYMLHSEADDTFALYLNVMLPGRQIPPHNHTTWACIAGIEGEERNTIYRRLDDGTRPGYAEIEVAEIVDVKPQGGIALMPEDIHSVEILGQNSIRHLHMYGRALESLTERLVFDLDAKTSRVMPMTVKTRR